MSHIARLALYPLSLVNTVAGLTLAGIAALTTSVPIWVSGPAAAIVLQGMYTLLWLENRLPLSKKRADVLLATGEAAALLTGTVGVVAALLAQTGTSDPEYGPPTMLAIVAVHGLAGLLAPDRRSPSTLAV